MEKFHIDYLPAFRFLAIDDLPEQQNEQREKTPRNGKLDWCNIWFL